MNHIQASLLDHNDVAEVLQTDPLNGLSFPEARDRLKRYGPNKLETSNIILLHFKIFCKQFLNPLIELVILCLITALSIGEYADAVLMTITIMTTCFIAYMQPNDVDRSLTELKKQMSKSCRVVRESQIHEINIEKLVPGDIICLAEGQKVPADVRLFGLSSLTVDESNLTGLSQPQAKIAEPTDDKIIKALSGDHSYSDQEISDLDNEILNNTENEKQCLAMHQNLALMGTIIETGHSRGIIINTGKSTRYGEVYSMLKRIVQPKSLKQDNIDKVSLDVIVVCCTLFSLWSIVGIVQEEPAANIFHYAISLTVLAIPEGLAAVLAIIESAGNFNHLDSFLIHQISASLALVTLVGAAFAAKLDTPFTAFQLLFINLITDGPVALSLGMEPVNELDLIVLPFGVRDSEIGFKLICRTVTLSSILIFVNGFMYYFLVSHHLDFSH